MAFVSIRNAMLWPLGVSNPTTADGNSTTAIDSTADRLAMIGRIYLNTGPGTSKTLSAAGGGSIGWRSGTVTFANAGTTVDIGLQDVDDTTGLPTRPDGAFDVAATFVGGGGGITTTAWQTSSMTGGTGSKTLTHGDKVAIVLDMTARAGADTIAMRGCPAPFQAFALAASFPGTVHFNGTTWAASLGYPNILITFDDGALGWIDACPPVDDQTSEAFQDSTNPDERGMIFQLPMDCKVDALAAALAQTAAGADGTITLYSDPLGTPASIASFTLNAEGGAANSGFNMQLLASDVSVTKNTDYCLAVRATGASNLTIQADTLPSAAARAAWTGTTNMRKGTRQNGTGAFAEESPAVTLYQMAVRISQIPDTASSGGGVIGE